MKRLRKLSLIEFLFLLFIFLLPWQTRLIWQETNLNGYVWEYGRFSLYGTEIILWLILFLYAIWLYKNRCLEKLNFSLFWQRLKNPLILNYWLIVILVLFSGLSVIWSLNSQLAYYSWFRVVEAAALFSFILIYNLPGENFFLVFIFSALGQSLFAIWQFFTQSVWPNKWLGLALHLPNVGGSIILQSQNERWLRAYGSLPHPNILAGFLLISLIFLFYLGLEAKSRRERIFILLALTAIVPALFFTFSRSAWLAFIVFIIFFGCWLKKQKNKIWSKQFLKISLLTFLITAVLISLFFEAFTTRIIGEQELEIASIHLRLAFTKQAWQLIKNQPWLGVGIGNYTLGVYQQVNASWPGYYYQPVHNVYLLILSELGIIGLAIFLVIIGMALLFTFKKMKNLYQITIFLSLLSLLIIGLFDHYLWTLYFGIIIFWLILGLNFKAMKSLDNS